MNLQRFFALHTGPLTLPDGEPAEGVVHDLGTIQVQSGRLAVAETTGLDAPVVVPVPPGEYGVRLTSMQVDEAYDFREREAYVSVLLSDQETVTVESAELELDTRKWKDEPAGGVAGVAGLHGVSTGGLGSVTIADAEAIVPGMPEDAGTWYDTVISVGDGSGWFERMDTDLEGPNGTVNALFPRATDGSSAISVIARKQKLFPILATRDVAGELTGIHIDLLVVGELTEHIAAFDGANKYAVEEAEERALQAMRAVDPPKKQGFFGRLFGR